MPVDTVLQLKCYCNEYEWGKKGSESLSARLCAKTPGTDFRIDESKTYAEMWMGTYPVLPSYILESGKDLQDVLDANPHLIGNIKEKFGHTKLPYLPKVLSIAKALPLQVHPNKELSAKIHKENPDDFTDPNHKPEIAVALSKFEAFCGWKPLKDISTLFALEPLRKYKPSSGSDVDDKQLKSIVKALLKEDPKTITHVQSELQRLPDEVFGKELLHVKQLLPRLQSQYGDQDPGNLVALTCMNYLVLEPGQSLYIPADGIHAYLAGDIIECMARSNNVINTGFCPRPDNKTIDTFAETLTFEPHSAKEAILPGKKFEKGRNGRSTVYAPPLSEFNVYRTAIKGEGKEYVESSKGPTIFIVTKGKGTLQADKKSHKLEEGSIFFVGALTEMDIEGTDLELWAAYCE